MFPQSSSPLPALRPPIAMFILCFFLLIGLHFFCSSHVPILRKEKDITQDPLQLEVAQNRQ